jgi:hypothetical protein
MKNALEIFASLGVRLGGAISEFRRYIDFDNVILFGGVLSPVKIDSSKKNNIKDIIINNAQKLLNARGLKIKIKSIAADSKYSAAIGAAYYVYKNELFSPPRFEAEGFAVEYRGYGHDFLHPFQTEFPNNEKNLETYLGGPNIVKRFKDFIEENKLTNLLTQKISYGNLTLDEAIKEVDRIKKLLDKKLEELDKKTLKELDQEAEKLEKLIEAINEFITDQAKTNQDILGFLKEIGSEFGHALGFYLVNIRDILIKNGVDGSKANELISNIVLVGGVAEHLGKGIKYDPLIRSVKEAINNVLKNTNIKGVKINLKRTKYKGKFPRDFWAFIPQEKDNYNIAIAVGGTKIQAGAIDENGTLVTESYKSEYWKKILTGKEILPSQVERARDGIIDYLEKLIREIKEDADKLGKKLKEIGISWAGPGRYWEGWVMAPNIWGFNKEPVNLIEELQKRLTDLGNIEIEIQHDGIAAAKGEISNVGTFKRKSSILSVIWGTGIGAGILIDEKAYYENSTFQVFAIPLGEIGHHMIFIF